MEWLWYVDRAAGLVAYAVLSLAVVTGLFSSGRAFGPLHRVARRVHIEVSVLALLVVGVHAVVGLVDTVLVVVGEVAAPSYGVEYLVAGVAVGLGATLVLLVSVLGFLDPRRFTRPWTPRVVHSFAYAGFGLATVHAAAVGTDLAGLARPLLVALGALLVYLLLLRVVGGAGRGVSSGPSSRGADQ